MQASHISGAGNTADAGDTADAEKTAAPTTGAAKQAWFSSAGWDSLWILSPALVSTALVLLLRDQMGQYENTPLWVWVCFVLLIDVAHVYGTLFRTYLDPQALSKNKAVLLGIPLIAWVGGSLLYSLDALFFWRVLAYLAVFHFIRQQYGFIVLYARNEDPQWKRFRWLDGAAVYMATIYPLLFWHTHFRNFSWFVAGDFFSSLPEFICQAGLAIYICVALAYCVKELAMARSGYFNIPKNVLLLGTALSWYAGIVAINSDVAFTITNVVSHGIPYMALIWLYHGQSKKERSEAQPAVVTAGKKSERKPWPHLIMSNACFFFVFLAALAYIEEGLWDGFVWREHLGLFSYFSRLPVINDAALLALLVPFLALPQSTHYLLDGFIWRVRDRNNIWSA